MSGAGNEYVYGSAARKIQYDVYEENQVLKAKKKRKQNGKVKAKLCLMVLFLFACGVLVTYRYSLITEQNYKIASSKKSLDNVKNDNVTLKVKIENSLDLSKIREVAETKLGMQKPDSYQIVYVKIAKEDYVQVTEMYQKDAKKKEGVFAYVENTFAKLGRLIY